MTASHGTSTRVYFNALDISGYLNTATLSGTTATADASVFTSPAKEYSVGQRDRTFTSAGYYAAAATAIIEPGLGASTGVLTFCPGGVAVGDYAWLSSVTGTSYAPSDNISGTVAFAFDAQTSGLTAFGYILHPFGEDTNTTTGSSKDDAAQTTTGWTAHLHVSAVDGGSWVVKLEDSANNSAWSDVSGGAFAAATGATSERLVSASGATLRRYVRYTATRTSGSAGDGITFALAVARTA